MLLAKGCAEVDSRGPVLVKKHASFHGIKHILLGKVSQKALEADTNSEKSCESEYHWMPLSRDFLVIEGNKSVQYKSMIT